MSDALRFSTQMPTFCIDPRGRKFHTTVSFSNPQGCRRGFKVKTSNRSRYVITPATHILQPYESVEVEFVLIGTGLSPSDVAGDRFCVQVADLPDVVREKKEAEEYLKKASVEVKKLYLQAAAVKGGVSAESSHRIFENSASSVLAKSGLFTSAIDLCEGGYATDEVGRLRAANKSLEKELKFLRVDL